MNTHHLEATAAQHLNTVPAPAFGSGTMSAESERTFVMLAHLFPLLVWPWKQSASPAVDVHGKEALNFGITLMLVMFPLGLVSSLLGTVIATLVSVICSVASFAVLALVVWAALQARAGKVLRYPLNLRLIK